MSENKNRLSGALAALAGTIAVFVLVIGMNEFADRDEADPSEAASRFEVSAEQAPPVEVVEPPPPPEREPVDPPRPTEISSEVGSIDIPVPSLDVSELSAGLNEIGDADGLVMTDETVDTPPRPVQQVPADYPRAARRDGLEGIVTLSLLIDVSGAIQNVRVVSADPAGVFEESAIAAVRQWQFEPARYQGEPVRVWARQRVSFRLN